MEQQLSQLLELAKTAKQEMVILPTNKKNAFLLSLAEALIAATKHILAENQKDLEVGRTKGLSEALLDRLSLTPERILAMAEGLGQLEKMPDSIGEIVSGWRHTNGMLIEEQRVPLGVIGMIYESRPNVTIDAAGLAIKSGNAIILRGSSSAIHSNICLAMIIKQELKHHAMPEGAIQLIVDTDRNIVTELITANTFLDVIIPRGGKGLKQFILQHATVPVIETGAGVCHIFVDETASLQKSVDIILNAKTQRPSTCNSIEAVLIHEKIATKAIPLITTALQQHEVKLYATEEIGSYIPTEIAYTFVDETAFGTEYLTKSIMLILVKTVDEAIRHINTYGTHHSDCIMTESIENSERFLNEVDSAVVYLNASTRFSDGEEFGFGAEIGISTQKLHARGPMGMKALTTTKYIVRGNGQTR